MATVVCVRWFADDLRSILGNDIHLAVSWFEIAR
jgi:hypothetical protein